MGLRGGFDFAGLILFVHGYWRWDGGWLSANALSRARWQVRRTWRKRDPAGCGRRHGSAVAYMTPRGLGKPHLPLLQSSVRRARLERVRLSYA